MEKTVTKAFGKKNYLLGKDEDGIWYWLTEASWDCDWYWSFGYVRSYTNNEHPERSRDYDSHQHFNRLFLEGPSMCKEMFDNFFIETPLNNNEKWKLLELMQTIYTLKEYSEVVYRGGSHIANNPLQEVIKSQEEYNRINKIVLPQLFEEVYRILEKTSTHRCKYCGGEAKGLEEDILCGECQFLFGHTFYSEL